MSETTTVSMPQIFADCCDGGGNLGRYALSDPYIDGEYAVATNGHILCRSRVASIQWAVPPYSSDRNLPKTSAAFFEKQFVAPIAIPPLVSRKCGMCDGSGEVYACDKCDGEGECECGECGSEVDCKQCGGSGWMKEQPVTGEAPSDCYSCKGYGLIYDRDWVPIGNANFDPCYLGMLQRHGVTHLQPSQDTKGLAPAYWRLNDEIEGVLMPCRVGAR